MRKLESTRRKIWKTVLIIFSAFLIAGIVYAAGFEWKCFYCQEMETTQKKSPPDSGDCEKSPNGEHKWIRYYH